MQPLIKTGAKATGEKWRDNWQTPTHILDAVDQFYGRGDRNEWFDPCPSHPIFNAFSLTKTSPGVVKKKMFINPPFSQYLKFLKHLLPFGGQQIWIMHHDHSTERMGLLMEAGTAMCLLSKRVSFIDPRTGKPSDSNGVGKSQTLIYVDEHFSRARLFREYFCHLGKCLDLY